MSKRHFEAIADALRRERPEPEGFAEPDRRQDYEFDLWRGIVVRMADICYGSNGRFDRERSYRAAGLS
ncbi:MAG TPA: hypothetical protein VFI15_02155 [Candidatus Limnocylindrales bacterium]|nr:hypothetical protein [Candidatus Limnocylindrales bacterium]